MNPALGDITRRLLEQRDLPVGTSLENRITWRLHRAGTLDKCQHRVGPYRLDFAWPALRVALEADGPHHWQPDIATRDVARDAFLRARGWLVFRVDGGSDTLEDQVARVSCIIHMLREEADQGRWPITGGSS